jgi:hypothetical protein
MAYLTCGRCGLEIKIRAAFLRIENCPRCLARSAIVSPLVLSTRALTPAAGGSPPAADHPSLQAPDPPLLDPAAQIGPSGQQR